MPSPATVYNIEKLIAEENDPKLRAFLILLNAINQSLISNTETTRELSDKLDAHLTRFEQKTAQDRSRLDQARGAWRVIAWVLGGVQVIGLGIWTYANSAIHEIKTAQAQLQVSNARIEQRLQTLEGSDK
mgnify:CR=1 FL=1